MLGYTRVKSQKASELERELHLNGYLWFHSPAQITLQVRKDQRASHSRSLQIRIRSRNAWYVVKLSDEPQNVVL